MRHKIVLFAAGAAMTAAGAAWAESETLASPEEVAAVNAELAKIGCKAEEVEKENAGLFEIDDAECEIGQFDIKLNADYKILVLTSDEKW